MKPIKNIEGYEYIPNELLGENGIDDLTFSPTDEFFSACKKTIWFACGKEGCENMFPDIESAEDCCDED